MSGIQTLTVLLSNHFYVPSGNSEKNNINNVKNYLGYFPVRINIFGKHKESKSMINIFYYY